MATSTIIVPTMSRAEVLRRREERAAAAAAAQSSQDRCDWAALPECVLVRVLRLLPLSTLAAAGQVCRRWRAASLAVLAPPVDGCATAGKAMSVFQAPRGLLDLAGTAYDNGGGQTSFALRLLLEDGTRVELCRLGRAMLSSAAPLRRYVEMFARCVLLLNAGGYFAAARFEAQRCVKHTSFHAYVCRKKCGGRQSTRDNSGSGQRRSIGAQIRRSQEEHFRGKVRAAVADWAALGLFDDATLWIAAPGPVNRADLFFPDSPLHAHAAVAAVPFPTVRPSYTEIRRVHSQLTQLKIVSPPAIG